MLSQVLKTYHLRLRFSQERYSYARRDILIKLTILQSKEYFFRFNLHNFILSKNSNDHESRV